MTAVSSRSRTILFASFIFCLPGSIQAAPKVVTDILPVQTLAARIMQGVGTPGLIVQPGSSPHDYALRPSDARNLQEADVVFWIGSDLTPWLEQPLEAVTREAAIVELLEAPGVTILPARTEHDHGDDEHGDEHGEHEDEHDGHAEEHAEHGDEHDDHAEEHAEHADEHDEHDSHFGGDPHVWLDPDNGLAIAEVIAAKLAEIDPENEAAYQENLINFSQEIKSLSAEVQVRMEDNSAKFLVYHDAYQYFEAHFGLTLADTIARSEGRTPGAARLQEVRDLIEAESIDCVFVEPQFPADIVESIASDTGIRIAVADPVGTVPLSGGGSYQGLISALADSFTGCLSGEQT